VNLVDSSLWLEYFAGSEAGERVEHVLTDGETLVVPSITIYEVFKKLLAELDEDRALLAVAHMKQARTVELDTDLAVYAAKIGRDHRLALADSVIYATGLKYGCTVWTQDKHFQGLPGVKYFSKN